MAVLSAAVVSMGAAVVSVSGAAVSVASSEDSSVDSFAPPSQAAKASAKVHTIRNANNFFIVYGFKFAAKISG